MVKVKNLPQIGNLTANRKLDSIVTIATTTFAQIFFKNSTLKQNPDIPL